jgi:HIV-1 Vpr-binding protein
LTSQGLHESASVLNREACLALMTSKQLTHKMTTPITVSTPTYNGLPPRPQLTNGSVMASPLKTPFRPQTSVQQQMQPRTASPRGHAYVTPTTSMATPPSSSIRINHRARKLIDTPSSSTTLSVMGGMPHLQSATPTSAKSAQKSYEVKNFSEFTETPNDDGSQGISLVSIVCDYLSAQHSLCKNPMATCPEFDLLVHHKCPDPRPKQSAPWNFTTRYMQRQIFAPFGGPDGRKLDRRLLYSRFRPIKTFRLVDEQETIENTFHRYVHLISAACFHLQFRTFLIRMSLMFHDLKNV